jgi:signal transduction histidine kinase
VQPDSLPPAVELSAYRIVQEALTNCIKHAADAVVHVRLTSSATSLEVEVCDQGGRSKDSGGDGGHGLVGMKERVSLLGGQFAAYANELGGFTVRATFPTHGGTR